MVKIRKIARGVVKRKRKSFVIIGCEGKNRTETIYLNHFSSRECIIKFSTGNHTDPVGMVNDLIQYMKKLNFNLNDGDKAYLLLDTDVNENKAEQIKQAKKNCEEKGIILITSTPTFEIWYLLHFKYTTKTYQNSKEVKNYIKNIIDKYTENMDVFDILKDRIGQAIKNANKLEMFQKSIHKELENENCNPYTSVHHLIEELVKRNKKDII